MVRLDGPTCMIRFLKKTINKAFGPLTRCKPNLDQENDHVPNLNVLISKYMAQKNSFEKK